MQSSTQLGTWARQDPADHYLVQRVMTATPAELTAMLYDAACANIRGAIARLEAGAPLEATPKLCKAQDILLELRCTLNHEAGALAGQLDALYTFAWRRLLDASVSRDASAAREALDVVDPLRTAWREACVTVAA